jgi:glyoxylase-like metal-dependent hydrolase (beta-lactamase superfamily II)
MIDSLSLVERQNIGWDKRIRSFTASDLVDLFVITTKRYLIVFDTGNAPEQMQEIMQKIEADLTNRQLLVINSHQHFDHTWGNAIFVQNGLYPAPIIGHQKSVQLLQEKPEEAYRFLSDMQIGRPFLDSVQIIAPTLSFSETFTIYGGDLTLELFPTPGHSSDHISVWIPEIKTLLAGDAAEHPIPYAAEDGSIEQLEQDLRYLQSFNPEFVLPCHGGSVGADLIEQNLHYFKSLRHKIMNVKTTTPFTHENASKIIGWSFEDAMQDMGLEASRFTEFYRRLHLQNIISIVNEEKNEA